MSNSQVGQIYQQIIGDVLDSSRVDLEENGVDESILEELKQGWQKKLSAQNLAAFPWDPKPDPPAPAPAPAAAAPQPVAAPAHHDVGTVNGSGMPQQGIQHTMPSYGQPPSNNGVKAEPGIKTEPGLDSMPAMTQFTNPEVRDRVINNLQTQYGSRADATINKLHESIGSAPNRAQYPGPQRPTGQQAPQQPRPMPQGANLQQQQQQQQYQQQLAAGSFQQRMPQPAQNGQKPAPSQFDGAAEEGVLLHQNAAGQTTELGRVEIDRMLHAQLEAKARAMEGGGLMIPLKRAKKPADVSYHRAQPGSGAGRFDGGDDDAKSEVDEDAINSDLDDTDDNADEDDDDDDGGQIMLCMYDKVQRVKNKWKCVLKDGVLSVNGRDYVFHKASGEYEW
ncbi:putative Transcription factor IIA, alpha/beta subunit [Seiridium unicorne]|uniref:Transcription factor IIA, alpha/beta subunit n=1 Tax=Seiridium unicorne TaxID=138068 RepID=A0ABR2UPL9_9PEZI